MERQSNDEHPARNIEQLGVLQHVDIGRSHRNGQQEQPDAGDVFVYKVNVKGLPDARFALEPNA